MRWDKFTSRLKLTPTARKRLGIGVVVLAIVYLADFSLLKLDKTERVQLSALNQHQPVVLVFGSYT